MTKTETITITSSTAGLCLLNCCTVETVSETNLFLLIIELSWLLIFLKNDMLLRKKDWRNEYFTMKLRYTFCSYFSYLKRQWDNTGQQFHWKRFLKIWESCQNRWNKLMNLHHKTLAINFRVSNSKSPLFFVE